MLVLKAWHSPLLKHIVILNKMARYGHLAIDYIEQGSSLLLKNDSQSFNHVDIIG